ncbi:unnamed protein product [Acanthoscelides obtectus]|uniref:Insulin receptor substrate 1 n=1 Tax=Acanthoscelides obtectus TaxID=200917 RepID=A0A9P0KA30_ACAOB|nr:unnamed protein product [Acanthoscelides obtectus]CAK1632360.1 Docking protein 2 [Acanthoscelides obtectus]
MQQEEAVHKGFLLLPPVGKLLKKSWQHKYCLLFKASRFGIDRLEIYDAAESKDCKIITLENCVKIHAKTPTTFCVTTKTATHEFGTTTEQNLSEWLSAIQSVAFPDDVSQMSCLEEDNDLYCSSGEGVFNVRLHPSPASQRCGLESNKNYTLLLTPTAIQLRNIVDDRLLYTWPYCYIRRYGYKNGRFTFEAGRKCESGEGAFFLEHPRQQEIFRNLATKMKSMKSLIAGQSTPSLLDSTDQLQAALTMEARSRTPLPPSSTSQSLETLSKSQMSICSFSQSQPSILEIDKPTPLPLKPPRKSLPPKPGQAEPPYEIVGRKPSPARQHSTEPSPAKQHSTESEIITTDLDDEYMSWGEVRRELDKMKSVRLDFKIDSNVSPTTEQISEPAPQTSKEVTGEYSKLNFFGTFSKVISSRYKQVFIPSSPATSDTPTANFYDEVEVNDTKVISVESKEAAPKMKFEERKEEVSFHPLRNRDDYTLISKPKHV